MKSLTRRTLAGIAVAALPVITLAVPASAATTVNLDCQANAPVVGPQQATISQDVDVTAPATVAPGGTLDAVVKPASLTVPSKVSSFTIKELNTFALKIPIPANSTYVNATLSGGSGLGDTPPTIAVADNVATVSFPGPIAGGATITLPTVDVTLKAGDSGTIETKLAGTSYTDPALTFNTIASSIIGDVTAPTSCFPNPSPVFSTTTIG